MEALKLAAAPAAPPPLPEITPEDEAAYRKLVDLRLTPEQAESIMEPPAVYARQKDVVALHWHPEYLPMEMIMERVDRTFPNREEELLIPTEHNIIHELKGFAGVEIDCYSPEFGLKVQLLAHFEAGRVVDNPKAAVLRAMLDHTRRYRGSQLFAFFETLLHPRHADRLQTAAAKVGANADLVAFVQAHAAKLKALLEQFEDETPEIMVKNKLIRNYFDLLRDLHDGAMIDRAQYFLQAVKKEVKKHFSLDYFYTAQEVIEEVRGLGGGLVIPHPEQFWPILLADYDVDGYEVWNPQSQEHTDFLIQVVARHNKTRRGDKRLLVFMGDDCHMGEKLKHPAHRNAEKASREIGVQPWEDLVLRKNLIVGGMERRSVIAEYRDRLTQ